MAQSFARGAALAQPIEAGSMHLVQGGSGVLEAGPLGAGIALSLHDPVAQVSGMLHFLLPRRQSPVPSVDPETLKERSLVYAMDVIPEFLHQALELGAQRERTVLCAAGGAGSIGDDGEFQIGRRNLAMLHKLLLRASIRLAAKAVGGTRARTLQLSLVDGTVRVLCAGAEKVLWRP